MGTRTKIATAAAVGVLTLAGFGVGLAAGDTGNGDANRARNEMHQQMGGNTGMDMDMSSMQKMHDAMDPAAMDDMHAEMVKQLPSEFRDEANAMHESMKSMHGSKSDSSSDSHTSHHPDES